MTMSKVACLTHYNTSREAEWAKEEEDGTHHSSR